MVNNLFKLIKNKSYRFNKDTSAQPEAGADIDVHALIRCTSEEAKAYIPVTLAQKLSVLPLAVIEMHNRKILTVAAYELSVELKQSLKFACDIEIKLIKLHKSVIRKAILLAYHGSEEVLIQNMQRLNNIPTKDIEQRNTTILFLADSQKNNSDCEVNNFLKTILTYAIAKKASDIHFLPCADGMRIKLRIDGELRTHENSVCSLEIYKRIISRIKTLSNLDITKNEITHDGSINYNLDDSNISIRVSIMPTIHGEKAVLRLHGIKDLIKLEHLGLDTKTLQMIKNVTNEMKGLLICTGATGSGKSTTLYAILDSISNLNKSIVTVEDPVEIKLDFASQTSINTKKGIGYNESLKSALRQDPDCIMIGELRDSESLQIAFQAALTGHLVITTLHAGSVIEALQRLYSLGCDKTLIAHTCKLIIHQNLHPKLCAHCKIIDLNASNRLEATVYKAVGCSKCDYSGYNERTVACETLLVDENTKQAIIELQNFSEFNKTFNPDNYISMQENIQYLFESGIIEEQ